jgi:hypothetical protein
MVTHNCNPSTPEAEEDHEFKASLNYIARPCLKKPKRKKKVAILVFSVIIILVPC